MGVPAGQNRGEVVPVALCGHPARGALTLSVNGQPRQRTDLAQLIWNVPEIIWQLSQQVKLAAGDIIMTGTPENVGPLVAGDTVAVGQVLATIDSAELQAAVASAAADVADAQAKLADAKSSGASTEQIAADAGRETLLVRPTVRVSAATIVGSSPGQCMLISCTASSEALPQTPHDEVV